MIDDAELRERLDTVIRTPDSAPVTRGNPSESVCRGTSEFDELMVDLEEEYDLDEETLDDIVEVRWPEDGDAEFRLKGEKEWKNAGEDEGSGDDSDVDDEGEQGSCYEDCSCPEDCSCETCPCGSGRVCCCDGKCTPV